MPRPARTTATPGTSAQRALTGVHCAQEAPREIEELKVRDPTFLLGKLGAECGPAQFIREATQNALEAIAALGSSAGGRVIWDVDWARLVASDGQHRKLSVTDTGCGMTHEALLLYVNHLAASSRDLGATGNFGTGLKIAAGWRNPFGLEYRSWKDGKGSLVRFMRTREGRWGLALQLWPDGTTAQWLPLSDAEKPWPLRGHDHGTQVIFLGQNEGDDTTVAPDEIKDGRKRWITRYLNMRYGSLPDNVEVLVREGLLLDRVRPHRGDLQRVHGERHHLNRRACDSGAEDLPDVRIDWWILDDDTDGRRSEGLEWLSTGHAAAFWQNELTDVLPPVHGGYTRLIEFGIRWAYERVVLWATPTLAPRALGDAEVKRALDLYAAAGASAEQLKAREATLRAGAARVESNLARTTLLVDHAPLPWARYAQLFARHMPAQLRRLQEETADRAIHADLSDQIAERLGQHRRILPVGRYIPPRRAGEATRRSGDTGVDDDAPAADAPIGAAEEPVDAAATGIDDPTTPVPAAVSLDGPSPEAAEQPEAPLALPEVIWVTSRDGSRPAGDLEDRAARFDRATQVLIVNGDFRVFRAMEALWRSSHGHVAGADLLIARSVREWFELALVEVILAARRLEGAVRWEDDDIDRLLSPEALTAAVLPRVAAFLHQKRNLTQRLGRQGAPTRSP